MRISCQGSGSEIKFRRLRRGPDLSRAIDRLVATDTKVWLIDYKTHRVRSAAQLRDLCDRYRAQLALYREGVQRIWPDRPVQTCLLFTHGGLDDLKKAREELAGKMEPGHSSWYRRLTGKYGHAVVPVVNNLCTGCFANIPSSFVSKTNVNKVQKCESCGRLLYWP